jgi:hypothetical protein
MRCVDPSGLPRRIPSAERAASLILLFRAMVVSLRETR